MAILHDRVYVVTGIVPSGQDNLTTKPAAIVTFAAAEYPREIFTLPVFADNAEAFRFGRPVSVTIVGAPSAAAPDTPDPLSLALQGLLDAVGRDQAVLEYFERAERPALDAAWAALRKAEGA